MPVDAPGSRHRTHETEYTTPTDDTGETSVPDDANVHEAGEGLSDDELAQQVAGQTPSEERYADVFKREADGVATETEAAKASADELAGGAGAQ
jgi:hypothetical protein